MKNNKTNKTAQPERMNLESLDVAAEKRELLRDCVRKAFPEALSNGKVDLDCLKLALGEHVETGKERFGLNWHGKAECMQVIQQPSVATLKPSREESVNFDETGNLFIEGDNLEVLKLLQKSYFGKVKMIYIDPPYNTGREFIYPDKYGETLDTYLQYTGQKDGNGRKFSTNTDTDGRYHSRWLSMMYPRLYLAKNLLREDGVIFISIDDNEQANLKFLCDHVFGEENFVSCVANISNPKGRSDDKYVATAHEYVLIYKKNDLSFVGWDSDEGIVKRYNKTDKKNEVFREIDLRKTGDNDRREDRPNMYYALFYDKSSGQLEVGSHDETRANKVKILPVKKDGSDGCWRWGKENTKKNLDQLIARYMPHRKIWSVFEKDYLKDRQGVKPTSAWSFKDVNSERGSKRFVDLGFNKEVFPKPKPVGTIYRMLKLATNKEAGDIVLDFFAGSSTIADAVMQLNKEDGGNRKFICVQLPEPCGETSEAHKAGYKTIADIGKERIRRAAKKIEEAQKQEENGKAGEIDFAAGDSAKQSAPLDFGFKAFSLASSNFKIWDGHAIHQYDKAWEDYTAAEKQAAEETLLNRAENHVAHTMPNSAPEDILYEILLKAGYPLTAKVEELVMAGKKVFSIDDKNVLICLDGELNQAVIDAMAEAKPCHVVFLDAGFRGNDQLKANAAQAFKARAQEEETEIVFRTV